MISPEWNATLVTLIFSLPVATSVVCALVVGAYSREAVNIPRRLAGILITALLMSAFAWGCVVLYIQWPILFIGVQAFFYYALLVFHVLLYQVICFITDTGQKKPFSTVHYIIPALIPAVLLIWSFFVPVDAQLHIVKSRGGAMSGYEIYTALFTSKAAGLFIWSLLYNLLSWKRIIAYRGVIGDYSADEGRSPVRWLRILILYMFSVIMLPVIAIGLGKAVFASSLWMVFPAMLTAVEIILLCYNIVSENYIVINEADEKKHAGPDKERRIDRAYFEHYINTQKPYLHSKLRIADLAADLHSNRTYVSNFINAEYGMNFSRYINRQRLRELDRLRLDPKNKNALGIDLVLQAGFSTYRGYIRAKTTEDKDSLLKEF